MKPLRLVFDTNVWLDWLVFGDAAVVPFKHAHAAGKIEICIDDACERELVTVLKYDRGKRALEACAQSECLAELRRRVCAWSPCSPEQAPDKLPNCRDLDDQKFLELARNCGADFLVTRDKALLVLARRKVRPPPCRIVTPPELGAILTVVH